MLSLTRGDRLPSVATCQLLLNVHRDDKDAIKVDGIVGPETRQALVQRLEQLSTAGVG